MIRMAGKAPDVKLSGNVHDLLDLHRPLAKMLGPMRDPSSTPLVSAPCFGGLYSLYQG